MPVIGAALHGLSVNGASTCVPSFVGAVLEVNLAMMYQ